MRSALDELAAAFVARTLPKSAWTHEAHLRVGLWHVLRHGEQEALPLLRDRIRALNEAHGVVNDDGGGYHETITRFYVWRIARFVQARAVHRAANEGGLSGDDALADALVAECGAKDLALAWWTRERLMSVDARMGWVGPDLLPLVPESCGSEGSTPTRS